MVARWFSGCSARYSCLNGYDLVAVSLSLGDEYNLCCTPAVSPVVFFLLDGCMCPGARHRQRQSMYLLHCPPKTSFRRQRFSVLGACLPGGLTHGTCIALTKTLRGWLSWLSRWKRRGRCAGSSASEVSVKSINFPRDFSFLAERCCSGASAGVLCFSQSGCDVSRLCGTGFLPLGNLAT